MSTSTADVKVGDRFVYTTPSGREFVYTVTQLDAVTPQGQTMPRATSDGIADVFIHDELLAQDWWRPLVEARS